jgi:hypothetical protein
VGGYAGDEAVTLINDRITFATEFPLRPGCVIWVGTVQAVVRRVLDDYTVDVVPYSWVAKVWWTLFGDEPNPLPLLPWWKVAP